MSIIDLFPEPLPEIPTLRNLNFVFDILPTNLTANMRTLWLPRLTVDDEEIPIVSAQLNRGENVLGETLTVELARVPDKDVFTQDAVVKFGVGRRIAGDWDEATFEWLIEDGELQNLSYDIQGDPHNMSDRVQVNVISGSTAKLSKTSETGLVIYDPLRVTINDGDIRSAYDAQRNEYKPVVVAIPNLKLSHLFQRVFVTECGFSAYKTNLKANDYPVQRYEVGMGERFYEGLRGLIGMFRPLERIDGNTIWILDSTLPQPPSFPPGRIITADRPTAVNQRTEKPKIDALRVNFVGVENNFDFITTDTKNSIESSGGVEIRTETITKEFRKVPPELAIPGTMVPESATIVVRTALKSENKRTFLAGSETEIGGEIDRTTDSYEYSGTSGLEGYPTVRQKTTKKRLPPLIVGSIADTPTLQNCLSERETFANQAHPFRPRAMYTARRLFRSTGVVTVDSENTNPDGTPYIRDAPTAFRSGNIAPLQEFFTQDLNYRKETATPLPNGNVRVKYFAIDLMTPLVTEDRTEERPGEIAMSGVSTNSDFVLVFAEDNAERSTDRIVDISIGELPLRHGLPLARRLLRQMQEAGEQSMALTHIGYDESVANKGVVIAPRDRDGEQIGQFVITGVAMNFDRSGLIMNISGRAVPHLNAPLVLQQIPGHRSTVEANSPFTFTLPIACVEGYYLGIDPVSVAHAAVEARPVVEPAAEWVDLESDTIDLTPFDGTDQDFEFRITFGTVSVMTTIQFDLVVAEIP